ncbi:MAG: UDP-N-acetylglucosamine 1-carboxyvinyltransferase, partial [Oscillospiraceae bacterium]|nr:UDP-N-acetylglucosamine 1-carboxyvinyltransferase [Oscillospiraceae bacterium]
MELLRIGGGRPLNGSLRIQGAKNSVLPIMAAALISGGTSVIHNCPKLSDVDVSIRILKHLGCAVTRDGTDVFIDSSGMSRHSIPDSLMREMRSSVVFLGAILARAGEAELSAPGGCELGPRPIDLHLAAIREFGSEIDKSGGRISVKLTKTADRASVRHISFPTPSVGATENAMLLAAGTPGKTIITNPAREPEIVDLQEFLLKLGVEVSGAGGGMITVCAPGEYAANAEHTIIPDRIVTATYLSAAASAGGHLRLLGANPEHLKPVIRSLREMGCEIFADSKTGELQITKKAPLKAAKPISTKPYPDFPTDAQPPVMAACLKAEGTTVFVENIFESRYRHIEELQRLGADITVSGKTAIVCGVPKLKGVEMFAADLRGGAALVVAALGADGESTIRELRHIDRGYE